MWPRPADPGGCVVLAGMAARLGDVYRPDRVAERLEGQGLYRLKGAYKARIGARLALVQLLNRNPGASLAALDGSAAEGLDEAISAQRRQLAARARADL